MKISRLTLTLTSQQAFKIRREFEIEGWLVTHMTQSAVMGGKQYRDYDGNLFTYDFVMERDTPMPVQRSNPGTEMGLTTKGVKS